jgi:hypothetical protein
MPQEQWNIHERGDLSIPAVETKEYRLIHSIEEFVVPLGNQLYNI